MNRILYISPFWTGVQPFFTQAKERFTGMPAFSQVLMQLMADNDSEVHVLFFTRKKLSIHLHPNWKDKVRVHVIRYPTLFLLLLLLPFFVLRVALYAVGHNIDIIFGHGSIGAIGGLASKVAGKPYIQRIYGTFLINEIKRSKAMLFLRHPLEFLSFWLPTKATVITNDGTHGDRVFERINGSQANLHFMLNGVSKEGVMEYQPAVGEKKITYVARVDRWKRQHLIVEVAHQLKQQKIDDIRFKVIGPIISETYLGEINALIQRYGLDEQVEIVGAVEAEEAKKEIATSLLTCSFYHTSNLGNVALESLVAGVPLLAVNCLQSMNSIPKKTFVEVPEDPVLIAQRIRELLENPAELKLVSEEAKRWAKLELMTWRERSDSEIEILFNHITTRT
jgi:glycosyltransferase involved in cell wall biosynthesis